MNGLELFEIPNARKCLSYNLNQKNTKIDKNYEQIKRLKHTTNQNQKILKIMMEKVSQIQKEMFVQFETKHERSTSSKICKLDKFHQVNNFEYLYVSIPRRNPFGKRIFNLDTSKSLFSTNEIIASKFKKEINNKYNEKT